MLPVKHLLDDTLPVEHLNRTCNALKTAGDTAASNELWQALTGSVQEHISLMLGLLERSADKDELIRGKIAAYRDVLAYPALLASKAQETANKNQELDVD